MELTVSCLNLLSLIFIVAPGSVFNISILVLDLLLALRLSRSSLYDAVKEDILLSLSSSFNENLVESSLVCSDKVCRFFSNFSSKCSYWSAMVSFRDSLNLS